MLNGLYATQYRVVCWRHLYAYVAYSQDSGERVKNASHFRYSRPAVRRRCVRERERARRLFFLVRALSHCLRPTPLELPLQSSCSVLSRQADSPLVSHLSFMPACSHLALSPSLSLPLSLSPPLSASPAPLFSLTPRVEWQTTCCRPIRTLGIL